MKTKQTNIIAWLCAACLLFSAESFAAKFPSYLEMEGTKITDCNKDALPANLVIPDGVTEIGMFAFSGCTSLATVTIPASVKTIEQGAFEYCFNIKTVQYKGTLAQWCEMDDYEFLTVTANTVTTSDVADLKAMTSLAIPEGVTKIGLGAFCDCKSLVTVSIPASVKIIETYTFDGCDNIKTVQYKGTLAQWCQMDNGSSLTSIANTITMSDVADLKAMTSIVIPEGVTKIGYCAFSNCESLKSIEIPKNITEIGVGAFYGCKALANVDIAEGVKKIYGSAFCGCTSLETITIPNSITEIGREAFLNCESLATISIPASVKSIGEAAFLGCKSLASVSIHLKTAKTSKQNSTRERSHSGASWTKMHLFSKKQMPSRCPTWQTLRR